MDTEHLLDEPAAADVLFAEYQEDHLAALEPCFRCTLDRAADDDRADLADRIMEWEATVTVPYSPVQNVGRSRQGERAMKRMYDRNPSFVARMDQLRAGMTDDMTATFNALPWHVRRLRRLRWHLWSRWMLRRMLWRQRFGIPPYERV